MYLHHGIMDISKTSKGAFKKLLNLTNRTIAFDNNQLLTPSGTLASVDWEDTEVVKGGFLIIERRAILSDTEINRINELLPEGTLGLVSMHFLREVRGTVLEGRVVSNIFVNKDKRVSFHSKFTG